MYNTSKEIACFLARCYRFIQRDPDNVEIKKIRRERNGWGKLEAIGGLCFKESQEIKLDYRYDMVATFIHEMLHMFYPHWREKRVLATEEKIVSKLSKRQVVRILSELSEKIDV